MSSFFTVPGAQKKRKRAAAPEASQKRIASAKPPHKSQPRKTGAPPKRQVERDESISGSDSESEIFSNEDEEVEESDEGSGSEAEQETAAERRLRLAERYLDNVKHDIDDEYGFDAEEIDRDLIAERLQEDIAESKGKVYRSVVSDLAIDQSTHSFFRNNTHSFTAIAVCAPYVYTTTKDLYVHKWQLQELPQHQYPQTTRKKPKKPPAPPRKRPDLKAWVRGNTQKATDKNYNRHVGEILCIAASSDGKYVVTGGADRRIIVYNAETLHPLKVFTHHRDSVTGLAFRRGTNQLYSCSKDRTVKVWSLDELAYIQTLFGHQDDVVDIDALAQERCISVGARDRTARLWKVVEETQLVFRGGAMEKKAAARLGVNPRSLTHEGTMDRVAMLDDDLFVTGSDNGSLALWSLQKKKPVFTVPLAHGLEHPMDPSDASAEAHPGPNVVPPPIPRFITALRTLPYADLIVTGSWDGHIRIWRLSDDKKSIEPAGVLSGPSQTDTQALTNGNKGDDLGPIKGVVNDIALFERGNKGVDGLCVVAAVGKEHRLGRWKMVEGGRNGGFVFEVPRIKKVLSKTSKNADVEMDSDEIGSE